MIRTFILSLFLCFVFQAVASSGEKLTVFINKTKFIRLNQAANTISIGNPQMLSLNLKSPRFLMLTGLKVGTTDIHILNKKGTTIFSKELLVVPSLVDTVIVNRGLDQTVKYICAPECVNVSGNKIDSTAPATSSGTSSATTNLNASGVN